MEAEQPDDVCAVGVEVLTLAGPIEADLRAGSFDPFVSHVSEHGSGRILAHGRAEMQAESEVRELGLRLGEQIRREPLEKHEAAAP